MSLKEVTLTNDTLRKVAPIVVTLSPTPDLRVDDVTAPNTVFSGSTINVTYKVKNYGVNTPALSNWKDKIYISKDLVFNAATAIEVMQPKSDSTYYYNAPKAELIIDTTLLNNQFYTKSKDIVIPNFISGQYYIHVFTNTTNSLYELVPNNNSNNKLVNVILTPTPKIQFNTPLTLSADTVSNSQTVSVNYKTINNGFYDNIEKNQGLRSTVYSNGTVYCQNYIREQGSSSWTDNIYISSDSSNFTASNAQLVGQYFNVDGTHSFAGLPAPSTPCGTVVPGFDNNKNIFNVLSPAKIFNASAIINIPANLPGGDYYIWAWANADKQVFEYPNTNEVIRSIKKIHVQNPDLAVAISPVAGPNYPSQNLRITYTISNNSSAGVYNNYRHDSLFISNSSVFDNSAVYVASNNISQNVIFNNPVSLYFNYIIPNNANGTLYFYIKTKGDALAETSYTNNISSIAVVISTAPASLLCDLQVTNFTVPDSSITGANIGLQYVITNAGPGTASGPWNDSVFVSCNPVFNSTATFLGVVSQSQNIAPANSITTSTIFYLNKANILSTCFPAANLYNTANFFVKTNANNGALEGANNNANNIMATGSVTLVEPRLDHTITQVNSVVDTVLIGRPFPANYTVKNLLFQSDLARQRFYFSPDSVLNNNAAECFDPNVTAMTPIGHNQSGSNTVRVTTPNLPTGDYYFLVNANYYNDINTSNDVNFIRNNSGFAKKIYIVNVPLPDFVDSIIESPVTIAVNQPITIKAIIANIGAGANFPANFTNQISLTNDVNSIGTIIASKTASKTLNQNQSLTDSITFTMPATIAAGNYLLQWKTNSQNTILETNANNNSAFKHITVVHPTPTDLVVSNIAIPDTAYLGYTIDTLKWSVVNNSANTATGYSNDAMYLSKNSVLDSTAILLGINNRFINILPNNKDTIAKQVLVDNAIEGNYNVLVKADASNNIVETNKTNNVTASTKQIFIKVKELPLNVLTPTTLSNSVNRYYKLKIDSSLLGATILVALKSNDSLSKTNQLFIGGSYIPNAGHYDFTYPTPNYGNQDVLITGATDSVYYITVRNTNSTAVQDISLKATVLPFAILNVNANSGGNTGNVTVKISGNLFTPNMVATLTDGSTTITASTIYFVNGTTVYATFNLAAKPLGIYSVNLFKPSNSTTASLNNSFTITKANNGGLVTGDGINGIPGNGNTPGCDPHATSGLNQQLGIDVVMQPRVIGEVPFPIYINYTNPTNVDIPAQIRVLTSDDYFTKLGTSLKTVNTGATSLVLTITEDGGPPGIIRAGASGTVVVYGQSPANTPGHVYLHFSLK